MNNNSSEVFAGSFCFVVARAQWRLCTGCHRTGITPETNNLPCAFCASCSSQGDFMSQNGMLSCTGLLLLTLGMSGCDFGKVEFDTGLEDPHNTEPVDSDEDGVPEDQDCDDHDASIYPGATEVCDGIDNDCDGYIDEHVTLTWYFDGDGDGYGDDLNILEACGAPHGYVEFPGDCDDTNPDANPGMTEICNSFDDNCDGAVDEGLSQAWYPDEDNDGFGDEDGEIESCYELEGYVSVDTDCDDANSAINPNEIEVCDGIDNDCDGFTDDTDGNLDMSTTLTWYADRDGDGYGDETTTDVGCEAPTGYVANDNDCDDYNSAINPGEREDCGNGIDDDCDGTADDPDTLYADTDGDGYGDAGSTITSCESVSGYVTDGTDCDDLDATIYPGADEHCDGVDTDCDGDLDEDDALDVLTWYADTDSDGYGDAYSMDLACDQPSGYVSDSSDCDDTVDSTNPGADEYCDGVDNDCDGTADESDAVDAATWYADTDSDSYGDPAMSVLGCSAPSGYVSDDTDCNDTDANTYPGATEVCDEVDNDCDTDVDEGLDVTWYADTDADGYGDATSTIEACSAPSGYVSDNTDCDDSDATSFPGGTEVCDHADNDCNGSVDEGVTSTFYADSDGDSYGDATSTTEDCSAPSGYTTDTSDCDDSDASIYPGADEYCDGVDNDCDSSVDEPDAVDVSTWYADTDADGYGDSTSTLAACTVPSGYVGDATDCDDSSSDVNPGVAEDCGNGIDDDCDGTADNPDTWYADADGDGYGDSSSITLDCSQPSGYVIDSTDCDDSDADANPAGYEYEFVLDPDSPNYLYEVGGCSDGVDGNCDGNIDSADWDCQDEDSDGFVNAVDPYQIDDSDGDGRQEVCVITENLYEPAWAYEDLIYQDSSSITSLSSSRTIAQTVISVSGVSVSAACHESSSTGRFDYGLVSTIGADGASSVDTSDCNDWIRPVEDVCDMFFDGHCYDFGGVSDGCSSLGLVGFGFYYDGSGAVSPINE